MFVCPVSSHPSGDRSTARLLGGAAYFLMQREDGTELALGSAWAASPEGHGVIKVSGKDKGVEESRR